MHPMKLQFSGYAALASLAGLMLAWFQIGRNEPLVPLTAVTCSIVLAATLFFAMSAAHFWWKTHLVPLKRWLGFYMSFGTSVLAGPFLPPTQVLPMPALTLTVVLAGILAMWLFIPPEYRHDLPRAQPSAQGQ